MMSLLRALQWWNEGKDQFIRGMVKACLYPCEDVLLILKSRVCFM